MAHANINPPLLSWARDRAGLSVTALAAKLHVKEAQVGAWERGESLPTFRQAQSFAEKTYIPFAYLFLRNPPTDELPIPDLRSVGDHQPREISIDLKDTLREVLRRQLWYRDYQIERDMNRVAAVGRANTSMTALNIVNDMRALMKLQPHPNRGSWEDYMRDLVLRIETIGILVMRSGMVGNNTFRKLNVREFRGFALTDEFAPVIFVNTSDCPEARLFTLIHELAHIWLGQSGISDSEPTNHHQTEQLCNAVAADFLVPEPEFTPRWRAQESWIDNLAPLAAHFHVSQWVIARRARELLLISEADYRAYIDRKLAEHQSREKRGKVSFQRTQPSKVSKRLARAVASEALSGRLLLRDAQQLIGIKPHRLAHFAQKELGI